MWCFLGAKKGGPTPPPSIIKARRSVFPPKSGLRLRQRRISRVSDPSPILSIALFCFDHLLSSIGCLLRSLPLIFFFLIFLRRDVWFLSRSDTGDASEFDVHGFWFGHQGMIFIDFFIYFFVWWFVCLLWGWSVGWWCWGFDCCVPVLIWDFLIWLCV